MIRKIVIAAAFVFAAAPALAQQGIYKPQQPTQSQPAQPVQPAAPLLPQATKPQSGTSGPQLQKINAALPQVMQQIQAYGMQQKGNPQTAAMVQALLMQADYMRNVTMVLMQQTQANGSISPGDKMKIQSMKQAAENVAPQVAKQKLIADKALKDQQTKLDEAAKKMEQSERAKQAKEQGGPLVAYQLALLQIRAQLDQIMLAEMAD